LLIGTAVLGQYAVAAEPSAAVVAQLDKDNDGTLDRKEVQGVIGESMFKAADSRSQPEAPHRLSELSAQ